MIKAKYLLIGYILGHFLTNLGSIRIIRINAGEEINSVDYFIVIGNILGALILGYIIGLVIFGIEKLIRPNNKTITEIDNIEEQNKKYNVSSSYPNIPKCNNCGGIVINKKVHKYPIACYCTIIFGVFIYFFLLMIDETSFYLALYFSLPVILVSAKF